MSIKQIHIENFRCFTKLDVSFEKFTTIVGENGTGKTAILEAINLAMSSSYVASRIDEQDFNNQDLGDIIIELVLSVPFIAKLPDGWVTQDIPCDRVRLQIKRRDKGAPGKALSEEFVVEHLVIPTQEVQRAKEGWVVKRKNGSDYEFSIRHLSFPLELENFPRSFYFDKHRENQSKVGFNSTLQRLVKDYNWRFRKSLPGNKDEYLNKWNELYELIVGNVDEKKLKDTFKPVKKKLISFLGAGYEGLELSVVNLEQPFSKGFFSVRTGLNQVEQTGLGSGVSMLLSYFFLETISQLSKEKLVILIDEPELHLYPQLQKKVRDQLKESDNQVIVSTHSVVMVDIGEWESIRRIDNKLLCHPRIETLDIMMKYKGSTKPIKNHLDELKKYYHDKTVFFRENNEVMFARAVLLVEGPNEKYGVSVLSKFYDLDISDLTIISCIGKNNVPYYQLICHAFQIPFFTLFDLDEKQPIDDENVTIITWLYCQHYFGFSNCFEFLFGTHKSEHKGSATMAKIDSCITKGSVPSELAEAFEKIKSFLSAINKKE